MQTALLENAGTDEVTLETSPPRKTSMEEKSELEGLVKFTKLVVPFFLLLGLLTVAALPVGLAVVK